VRNKVAFFDTFAAMGGADRMAEWVKAEPQQAYKDHVHFTVAGYRRWADELSTALLSAYDRHRVALKLPPSKAATAAPATAPLTKH
jgi:lysophospholipase L1-like esterase